MRLVAGVCVGPGDTFDKFARPSLETLHVPILTRRDQRSICAAYNDIAREALAIDAEALLLVHDDVEILDSGLVSKLDGLFADRTIGLVGVIGASNVTSLYWWEGQMHGRVDETRGLLDFGANVHDVDAVDGLFLALPRSVLKQVRFDEQHYNAFHGYDIDIAFAIKHAGYRVVVAPIDVFHHTKGGEGDRVAFLRANRAWRLKWMPSPSAKRRVARCLYYYQSLLAATFRRHVHVSSGRTPQAP